MKKAARGILYLLVILLAMPVSGFSEALPERDPAWLNVLLIGADTRANLMEEGRADTIIVASLNKETGAIRLISLARDMWIQLPGSDVHNKINTAFRFGGADMMMKAVNQTLGLNITEYVAINFYGFCDAIDMLGGIEVELTSAETTVVNNTVEEKYGEEVAARLRHEDGVQLLNGAQALAYARIRHLDNDFGRSQRQRNVVTAVINKVKALGVLEQASLIKQCFNYVDTNIGLLDMISLAKTVMDKGIGDIRQLGLPSEGNFRYGSGKSKLIFDPEATMQEALTFIYGQ